jgi:hypothetical protein
MTEASASAPELATALGTPTAVHAALTSPSQLGSATPRSVPFPPVCSACVPHVRTVVDVGFGFRAQIPCRGRELSALIERLEVELLAVIKHADMLAQARARAWMHVHAQICTRASCTRVYMHPLSLARTTHLHAHTRTRVCTTQMQLAYTRTYKRKHSRTPTQPHHAHSRGGGG